MRYALLSLAGRTGYFLKAQRALKALVECIPLFKRRRRMVSFQYLMALFEKAPLANSQQDWEMLLPWNIFTG